MTNLPNNSVYDARSYVFSERDSILVDTNIWLYLYPPSLRSPGFFEKVYSSTFDKMLKSRSRIYIDDFIVSEYMNSYLRIAFKVFKSLPSKEDFKEFRSTPDGLAALKNIEMNLHSILRFTTRINSNLSDSDFRHAITVACGGEMDFNDSLITQHCLMHNLVLFTNDRDMCYGGIPVVTHNQKLLRG